MRRSLRPPLVSRPRTPTRLRFRPGVSRSRWQIDRGPREALEVHPGSTSPREFVEALQAAGYEFEVGGRGGVEGPVDEARRIGPALVAPLLLWLPFGGLPAGSFPIGRGHG